MTKPWCVLLAGRESPQRPAPKEHALNAIQRQSALTNRDPLFATLCRAATVVSREEIAAVVSVPAELWRRTALESLDVGNLLVQPRHRGTAYEVLLALLRLERCPSLKATPILFLPSDHVVEDEEIMTRALKSMSEWIISEPRPVYLLGAVPHGPHDELGYIIPWHDAMQMPTSVYEFIEKPLMHRARKLINAGGLWNTFIFGGTVIALLELYSREFSAQVETLRRALENEHIDPTVLSRIYDGLRPMDFSHDVLARQTDSLHVLRLPRCGWWPLKSPKLDLLPQGAASRH